ncbi:WhiB family transcriptional regulator [Streptomyces sp. NWU339]|uniref:WhiB family transcriptional regulator n=1 Tax=Streptomyces sp. NWU339 TaxID=2185284 RepID=UPI000D672EB5|nr:WhiB family transcriptional regulator [Streptomyces sp. NWU339]PWI07380.1 WhiB family transcriptional regulator [Streptomyces sp. NWU339]
MPDNCLPSRFSTDLFPAARGWIRDAACVDEDPELFFLLIERDNEPQVARARAVCRRCRVLLACRRWAVEQGEDVGIWGATTAAQRRAIRRELLDGPAGRTTGRAVRARRE